MKKFILVSATVAAIVFSGCAQKSPEVSTEEATTTTTETPASQEVVSSTDKAIDTSVEAVKELTTVYFDFDKFNIRSDMKEVINTDAEILTNDVAKDVSLKLEGNCDEWGTDEYNYALGLKRAKAVKDALKAKGVDTSKISIVSNGKSNPVCTERSKSCDAQNRRVDFKLLP